MKEVNARVMRTLDSMGVEDYSPYHYYPASPRSFAKALRASASSNPRKNSKMNPSKAWMVDLSHGVDYYKTKGTRCYLTRDGKSGFAITADEIVLVFFREAIKRVL